MRSFTTYIAAAGLAGAVAAQYFPPTPEGIKVLKSKHQEGVTISYKEVDKQMSICCVPLANSVY